MDAPKVALDAVLLASESLPEGSGPVVRGYDFSAGIDYTAILDSYITTGFQATNFGKAVEEINRMLDCKHSVIEDPYEVNINPHNRDNKNCTIFLSFTSNIISSGLRETVRFLAQHNLIDAIVTSAGGVEEDFIKCMKPCYIGDFHKWEGAHLRSLAVNRIGNLLAPNSNYVEFENWLMPILAQMLKEQKADSVRWTPSKLIHRLGKEINNPDSVYYWCYKNNIPVFCPGLTDGSLGDILYFNSFKNPDFVLDVIEDIRLINSTAAYSKHTGIIIIGGGIAKHHTCNANLMHNGADFAVFINTANEFDGSDSGARPDEAKSWGKIRATTTAVKLYAEATLVFPLLVAQTFAKRIFPTNLEKGDGSKFQ